MAQNVADVVSSIEVWATLLLAAASFGLSVWAFVDAATRRADAFLAVNRLSKTAWLVILAVATLVAAASVSLSLFLTLIALGAALVYLLGTRPKIREVTAGSRTNQGPYGPW